MSAKKKLFKIAFWVFVVLVLFATLTPLDGIEIDIEFSLIDIDKLIHLCIFFMLTLLLFFAYPDRLQTIWIFIYLSTYGILIEVLQQVLPLGRSFDWFDWLYDMLGVGIGLLIISLFRKTIKQSIL